MRMLRAVLALGLFAMPLAAQDSTTSQSSIVPWRTSYFPYFTVSPNDGLMGMARVLVFHQANYDDRVSLRDAVAFEGGYSTKDAWLLRGRVDMPMLQRGWRLAASVEGGQEPHFGTPDPPTGTFTERARVGGWLDVTHRVAGPLSVAVRGGVDHQRVTGNSDLYDRYPRTQFESVGCPPEMLCASDGALRARQTDVNARAALVLDLRDREFDTRTGALVESGFFVGTGGGDQSYYGGYAVARGWVSPRRGTRLTSRIGLQAVSQTDAMGILQVIPTWEAPITTFGGTQSHRGLGVGEMAGRGRLLAGAEIRHDILNVGELGAMTAVLFVDGGRVFRDPSPLADPAPGSTISTGKLALSFDDWTVGIGGGVAIRVLRSAQLIVTAARGAGVTRWYVSSGWSW